MCIVLLHVTVSCLLTEKYTMGGWRDCSFLRFHSLRESSAVPMQVGNEIEGGVVDRTGIGDTWWRYRWRCGGPYRNRTGVSPMRRVRTASMLTAPPAQISLRRTKRFSEPVVRLGVYLVYRIWNNELKETLLFWSFFLFNRFWLSVSFC